MEQKCDPPNGTEIQVPREPPIVPDEEFANPAPMPPSGPPPVARDPYDPSTSSSPTPGPPSDPDITPLMPDEDKMNAEPTLDTSEWDWRRYVGLGLLLGQKDGLVSSSTRRGSAWRRADGNALLSGF